MGINVLTLTLFLLITLCYCQNDLSHRCSKPGPQCADCNTAIICTEDEDNFVVTEFETCMIPDTCDKGVCTNIPNNNCSGVKFQCQTVEGMYPDPQSCKKFNYCIGTGQGESSEDLQLYTSECKDDYAYNPLTTYCDKKIPANEECPVSSIPTCTVPGETGALPENPSIYYTCTPVRVKVLYPYLNACKHGKKYDGATYTCE
ncbi:hypothetical protein FQR65_LT13257 [Abscondita terminalis]|nr:hypothetical protein FQR65_LT13257 [Abscondita terminalis]